MQGAGVQYTLVNGRALPGGGGYQRPAVALVCNFPPGGATPLSVVAVQTLFHEFGHVRRCLGRACVIQGRIPDAQSHAPACSLNATFASIQEVARWKAQLGADWRCSWQVLNALLNTTEFQVSLHALKLDDAMCEHVCQHYPEHCLGSRLT